MKFNYFDLGLFKGTELYWMVNNILPELGVENYHCYGFEACHRYAMYNKENFYNNKKIDILNYAISNENGFKTLYYHPNALGHSIFPTKKGVDVSQHERVESIVFSDWLKNNVPDFEESFNVLKVNIEGAEWHLFQDLEKNDLFKHINLFCGAGHDVEKISELSHKIDEYYGIIEDNDITIHRFSEWKPERNADIAGLIKAML
tara:strand:+ start:46 stop:654 length:609 start_codon:yes stop_codon:yes gene_type:complete